MDGCAVQNHGETLPDQLGIRNATLPDLGDDDVNDVRQQRSDRRPVGLFLRILNHLLFESGDVQQRGALPVDLRGQDHTKEIDTAQQSRVSFLQRDVLKDRLHRPLLIAEAEGANLGVAHLERAFVNIEC